jgi:phosphatidylglycerophosphate synthase
MKLFATKKSLPAEWKRVRREKLLKIKRRIEGILDKEHSLTAKEKSRRDSFFRPLSRICRNVGIRANYISIGGVFLVCVQIYFFLVGQEIYGLITAVIAAFTDMIDGPVARFKYTDAGTDDVTAFGTLLDHFRDYFLAFTFGYFAFFYQNILRPLEFILFLIILFLYLGIFIGTLFKLRRYRIKNRSIEKRLHGFLLPDMQTSFWGRAQFFLIIVGTILLFVGHMQDILFLVQFSYVVLGAHIGVNFRNLLEGYILD